MSYIHKRLLFSLCSALFASLGTIQAQEGLMGYWDPQVSINYKVTGVYSHNFSLINRSYLIDQGELRAKVRQFELVHFSNLEIRDDQSLALGIQYRFRNHFDGGPNQLRITQQYNLHHNPFVLRFGHRLRAEQQYHKDFTIHRFRYRFAVDFPLQGQKTDPGEPYLVASMEQLLSVGKGASPQYDARLVGQIGWELEPGFKLQMGLEYRLEEYSSGMPQSILILLTSAQLSL